MSPEATSRMRTRPWHGLALLCGTALTALSLVLFAITRAVSLDLALSMFFAGDIFSIGSVVASVWAPPGFRVSAFSAAAVWMVGFSCRRMELCFAGRAGRGVRKSDAYAGASAGVCGGGARDFPADSWRLGKDGTHAYSPGGGERGCTDRCTPNGVETAN